MKTLRPLFLVPLAFLLVTTGCSKTSDLTPEPAGECAVIDSRHWHGWLDKYSETPGKYRLRIVGEVDLPSTGYSVSVHPGKITKGSMPNQDIYLTTTIAEGMHAQVISPTKIDYSLDVPSPAYGRISLICGEKVIGTIVDARLSD